MLLYLSNSNKRTYSSSPNIQKCLPCSNIQFKRKQHKISLRKKLPKKNFNKQIIKGKFLKSLSNKNSNCLITRFLKNICSKNLLMLLIMIILLKDSSRSEITKMTFWVTVKRAHQRRKAANKSNSRSWISQNRSSNNTNRKIKTWRNCNHTFSKLKQLKIKENKVLIVMISSWWKPKLTKLARTNCKLNLHKRHNKKNQVMKEIVTNLKLIKTLRWNNVMTRKYQLSKIHSMFKTSNKLTLNLNQMINPMKMIHILRFLNKYTELKVQNINKLNHLLHKFTIVDQLLELNNQCLTTLRTITARANWKVKKIEKRN